VTLTIKDPGLEAHLAEKARAAGVSVDEYLERLVREDKRQHEELRADVRAGFASIENGARTAYSEESLKELFDEVEAEGLKRSSERQAAPK
jgi:hypothetical protein